MNSKNRKLIIPDVIESINESKNVTEAISYENKIACMYASPIMFLGCFIQVIACFFIQDPAEIKFFIVNSILFFILGLFFEVLLRAPLPQKFKTPAINVLYASWLMLMFFRLSDYIGPSVWIVASIQIIFAMSRIRKDMILFVGSVTILSIIYFIINPMDYKNELASFYIFPQMLMLILLIFMTAIIHRLNEDRYHRLCDRLQREIDQKEDILSLYEAIAATEEELRHQNEQIKENEEILYELAYYDPLTELPNRKMFMEQLESIISRSAANQTVFYLVYIDLDSFKKINDTLGHMVGDTYIHSMAKKMAELINSQDFIGRVGGDEFVLIIRRNLSRDEVYREIEAIRLGIMAPIRLGNSEIRTTASFGIAEFPKDGDNSSDLLKHADLAMYKAKESKNSVKFFEESMQTEIMKRNYIEKRLIRGIERGEFKLVFQPQYDTQGKILRGIEALVRWNSPDQGLVSPMEFIPLAEEMGLIIPLGLWILETACQKYMELKERYHLDACLSVNISAVQIMESTFPDTVKKILDTTGMEPDSLELEITESVFIKSIKVAGPILNRLKALGVKIALDDFGTGYSSLNYLKMLPIDTLKIDKSFMDDLSDASVQVCIVEDIISLGHKLGLTVIAEGVEHLWQMDYLKKHACDFIQGFLFSKPLEDDALEALISGYTEIPIV